MPLPSVTMLSTCRKGPGTTDDMGAWVHGDRASHCVNECWFSEIILIALALCRAEIGTCAGVRGKVIEVVVLASTCARRTCTLSALSRARCQHCQHGGM